MWSIPKRKWFGTFISKIF